jgi:hypothetical protein
MIIDENSKLFSPPQLGEEEGKDLSKICFAPLVAASVDTVVENCTVQSVLGYLQNNRNLTDDYIDIITRCIQ